MKKDEIVFYIADTDWGVDYTGALTLKDSSGKAYAILAVDVDVSSISKVVKKYSTQTVLLILGLGTGFTLLFLMWARSTVTTPIRTLEKGVINFVNQTHHKKDPSELNFNKPDIHTQNEVESLANAMSQMSSDMRSYIKEIIDAENVANQMVTLATKDPLTGIRNKTSYDHEVIKLQRRLSSGELTAFGLAMIDMNFLKVINDTYGHEKGNLSIKKLSELVCDVFEHSPVFRIGGDEFIVILMGRDYDNREGLIVEFHNQLDDLVASDTLPPWEKISAAVGVAVYDPSADDTIESVFKRADLEMYSNKKAMKAERK
jgi:diguanylate cyclase (GGDEF)-like protein